jgi:glycosyltransferase involved in cell wall biosynthesis
LYEGFGLPVVEAMAVGTPVITSNTSSLPEVGGDAVVYVNPTDVNEIKDALRLVLNDKDQRELMKKRGLKQSSRFSWHECAEKTAKVYQDVLKS